MTDFDSFDGSHEQAYAVALMQLNELIEAGRDEDADRDAVRDVMDMHWNRVETARGNGRATTRSICKCFRTVE